MYIQSGYYMLNHFLIMKLDLTPFHNWPQKDWVWNKRFCMSVVKPNSQSRQSMACSSHAMRQSSQWWRSLSNKPIGKRFTTIMLCSTMFQARGRSISTGAWDMCGTSVTHGGKQVKREVHSKLCLGLLLCFTSGILIPCIRTDILPCSIAVPIST